MNLFKTVSFIFLLSLSDVLSQPSITKLTLTEFDRVENDFMRKLIKETSKNGTPTKEFNQELADIAQKEADRLASVEKLEFPSIDLSIKKYYGFSREMVGKVQLNNGN
jgi:hypothetical protein